MCAVLQVVRGEREGGKCADEAVTRNELRQVGGNRKGVKEGFCKEATEKEGSSRSLSLGLERSLVSSL